QRPAVAIGQREGGDGGVAVDLADLDRLLRRGGGRLQEGQQTPPSAMQCSSHRALPLAPINDGVRAWLGQWGCGMREDEITNHRHCHHPHLSSHLHFRHLPLALPCLCPLRAGEGHGTSPITRSFPCKTKTAPKI